MGLLTRSWRELARALPGSAPQRQRELRWMMEHVQSAASDASEGAAAGAGAGAGAAPRIVTSDWHALAAEEQFARLTVSQRRAVQRLVARRGTGEPLQYVLGEWPFAGLSLLTRAPTLIPRPDTEQWVMSVADRYAAAMRAAAHTHAPAPLYVVDLCTGSGCVALALAAHIPNAHVLGVDTSAAALSLARDNWSRVQEQVLTSPAQRHLAPLRSTVRFAHADVTDSAQLSAVVAAHAPKASAPAADAAAGRPHLIVANPPYISRTAYGRLDPSVRRFEDRAALVGGGANGWSLYDSIARWARGAWAPHPVLHAAAAVAAAPAGRALPAVVMELAGTQRCARAVAQYHVRAGWQAGVSVHSDYAGRMRWSEAAPDTAAV